MKKLGIVFIIFALAFVSCDNVDKVDSISKQDKKAKKIRNEQVEGQTETTYSGDNSYWFVVVQSKKSGSRLMNTCVKQNHSYFSAAELKATFKEDVFILNIVEVSRGTYEHN